MMKKKSNKEKLKKRRSQMKVMKRIKKNLKMNLIILKIHNKNLLLMINL